MHTMKMVQRGEKKAFIMLFFLLSLTLEYEKNYNNKNNA